MIKKLVFSYDYVELKGKFFKRFLMGEKFRESSVENIWICADCFLGYIIALVKVCGWKRYKNNCNK